MKLIEEKELARLLLDSAKLDALVCAGVDNWEGYDYAFDEDTFGGVRFNQVSEMTIEELTKDYRNYETDNTKI